MVGLGIRSRLSACVPLIVVAGLGFLRPLAAWGQPPAAPDMTELGVEQLLNLPVSAASKFPQKLSEAPANVTVITAADIAAYGYRTLTDVLASIPALSVYSDRNYDFLGVRGLTRSGDFNGRVLTVIDGYRANETVYGAAGIGTEFLIDVDMIDRVEFVPGPGSSIYGSNAIYGVINVITKKGRHFKGPVASVEAGTQGTGKQRLTFGQRFDNGLDLVLSGASYERAGEDLHFAQYDTPQTNNGWARGLDSDRYRSVLAKVGWGSWSFESAWARRPKSLPTGEYGCVFSDPRCETVDVQNLYQLTYDAAFGDVNLQARAYQGRYDYTGVYPYDNGGGTVVVNHDGSRAAWWGGEAKLVGVWDRHKAIGGVEYTYHQHVDQFNYDTDPYTQYTEYHRTRSVIGLYLQDEMRVLPQLSLSAGARSDDLDEYGHAVSPRLALIFRATPEETVKLTYGSAFRAPNAYESYYEQPGVQKGNPDLDPETTRNVDLIFEQLREGRWRWSASAFHNTIDSLITQVTDPNDGLLVFRNVSRTEANGGQLAAELLWHGARSRASYSYQHVIDADTGARITNSPHHLAKLNLTAPVPGTALSPGLEMLYTGSRLTLGGETGGYLLTNLTLSWPGLARGLELSATAYNLLDRKYGWVAPDEMAGNALFALDGDGRALRLKLQYAF